VTKTSTEECQRLAALRSLMSPCELCPRNCRVNRTEGQIGFCGIGDSFTISSSGPHFGEEPVLVGAGGSGTIFITGCNLGCLFCQNYEISILKQGRTVGIDRVVEMMLSLEKSGCCNINFVTPTHQIPFILEAIIRSRSRGLRVPIVYNCGGYESIDVLKLLAGYIEIYMPDVKFFDRELAQQFTGREDYPDVVREVVKEMHRQVGDLTTENGVAKRGLLVRHLVMPEAVEDSKRIIDFLADEISDKTYVNVMAQYRPCHRAGEFPQIARRTDSGEWQEAYDYAGRRSLRLAR